MRAINVELCLEVPANSRVGGIINVHFLLPALFPFCEQSLSPGGYLLLETVPGCGGNYLELPKANELRSALEMLFELEFYRERKVGPVACDAVTVQVLAKKRYQPSESSAQKVVCPVVKPRHL